MYLLQLKKIRVVCIIVFVIVLALLIVVLFSSRNELMVYFFNVGQGDSALIKLPKNIQILIDGGPDERVMEKLGRHMPFYDRKIEYVILSHPHSDHLRGLLSVLNRYEVGLFIHNGVSNNTESYKLLRSVIQEKEIAELIIDSPNQIKFTKDSYIEFLYPDHSLQSNELKDLNEASVVVKLTHGNTNWLFTGDIPTDIEEHLIGTGIDLNVDVLKVAHQGSKTSSGDNFLDEVSPIYGVISVGENKFGHPHFRTLHTLKSKGIEILRTDELGDIIFRSDGEIIKLK